MGIDNGLHRVVQNLPAVRAADVIIVVAGMDGSLPSVIAGLVDSPVVRRSGLGKPASVMHEGPVYARRLRSYRTTTSCPWFVMLHISGRTDACHAATTQTNGLNISALCAAQIAVPTSVGYGAAFGGVSPLLSALTAGAPGVATVNVRPPVSALLCVAVMMCA